MAGVNVYDGAIDRGLEGVIACTTKISSIVDVTLTYRGYTIDDLAENASFEDVVFLLWNNRLPKKNELDQLRKDLVSNMKLSDSIKNLMKTLPTKNVVPMSYLRTVVSALALEDPDATDISLEANKRKAFRLTGAVSAIVAGFHRIREGKDIVEPNLDHGMGWNFLNMLTGSAPNPKIAKMFDTCLTLHADHELNCSAFAARVTSSSLSDLHSAITSAIGALKGPLHGGANEQVIRMIQEIGTIENAKKFVEEAIKNKSKVMGIGHRVYKNGDPRARILKQMSKDITAETNQTDLFEMSRIIEETMLAQKGLMPNVDFYSASVYFCMGIPIDIFTPIFAASRVSGWIAHVLEQYENNRIYRPRGKYDGGLNLTWVAPEER